ncbi:hypothetical protein WAI453_000060 [Rhynchosporium graminicola]|uniref:Uncharacterized protein n=1 Tax=Rhynchosporium graminicola TaxID=2792576 RepID=A0A1E1K1T4_9HELO|nr:uncharacterized protein RCO7_00687 [Rhynchosporium commune]
MAATADSSKPFIPLSGIAEDGLSNEKEATATYFCVAVQLVIPTQGPGLVNAFVCDSRKVTALMLASSVTIRD